MRHATLQTFADTLQTLRDADNVADVDTRLTRLANVLHCRRHRYRGRFAQPGGGAITHVLGNLIGNGATATQHDATALFTEIESRAQSRVTPLRWEHLSLSASESHVLQRLTHDVSPRHLVTYPVFTPAGACGTLTLGLPVSRLRARDQAWIAHAGTTLASHVHEAVWRLVLAQTQASRPRLTPRERECLQWVARGKTSWEIGRILTISEHGVVHHLRSVMHKLDVTSRHRAVRIASDYGLLGDGSVR